MSVGTAVVFLVAVDDWTTFVMMAEVAVEPVEITFELVTVLMTEGVEAAIVGMLNCLCRINPQTAPS